MAMSPRESPFPLSVLALDCQLVLPAVLECNSQSKLHLAAGRARFGELASPGVPLGRAVEDGQIPLTHAIAGLAGLPLGSSRDRPDTSSEIEVELQGYPQSERIRW